MLESESSLEFRLSYFVSAQQFILHSFSCCPHQNLATILSISIQRVLGNLKQLLANIGIVRATDLINTSLPPCDNSLPFQEWSLCHNFPFISEKAFLLDFSMNGGRPKYFSYWCDWVVSQRVRISSLTLSWTFPLKTIVVLEVSIHCLNALVYLQSTSSSFLDDSLLALQNTRLSSTNNRWLSCGALWL